MDNEINNYTKNIISSVGSKLDQDQTNEILEKFIIPKLKDSIKITKSTWSNASGYYFYNKWNSFTNMPNNQLKDKIMIILNSVYDNEYWLLITKSILTKQKNMSFLLSNLKDIGFEKTLNKNKNLIGFENGVYDLEKGQFRESLLQDYVSLSVGYDYEEYTLEHEYINYIKEIFLMAQPDETMRKYIYKLLAYCIDGRSNIEMFMVWCEKTEYSGIREILELFKLAFGEYCITFPYSFLTKRFDAASPEFPNLMHKRMIIFEKAENDHKILIGRLKEIITDFKVLLPCNKLPSIPSTDGGLWRRLRATQWESDNVNIHEDTPFEKLELWKKVFMWYLLKVCYQIYEQEGIVGPDKVIHFTKKYKDQNDIFYEFIDSELEITNNNNDYESYDVLYSSLKCWYHEAYCGRCPIAKKELFDYLINKNYKVDKKYLYGVKFRENEPNLEKLENIKKIKNPENPENHENPEMIEGEI